ncbi:uncharacterized protein LOC126708752 isoform X3 [Quercus robur]|uniref:uncharacterized protein LOC126708752 isoform X1 n=1 Tax=Quercus robur TaxID=38942 RepID=UPI002162A466|nr:uncharacterized protein LOC126708752 isoform X1 [Quercus robur]XP_050264632.1 uncharacterized protein LOC126708752 isoform X2 [Quercus robur]XP_050264633.1 uncharacterized protein LOC126708752 isoform X3 [Quercus robur]
MSSTRSGRHHRPSSSSPVSSNSLLKSIKEPSHNIFPSKDEFLRLVAVLAIASSVAVCCNIFFTLINRQPKPFCDSHNSHSPDSISDFCEPCPSNGECNQGKLECVRGYRKHGKLCVEDGDINETAKKLLKWIEIHLCEAQAQFLCDGLGAVWVREDDIWKELDGHDLVKNVGLDDGTFLYTKQRAMDAVSRLLETRTDPHGIKELKCPDLLAEHYKPVAYRICQWLFEHALIVFPVSTLFIGCTVLFWKVHQRQYMSSRVEELYHQVCEILEDNALLSKRENGECEPWVVASRLRDHLLLPRERKNPVLWKKVEELVQEDSRVDRYPKLVKGESKVVWEWQVEGSLSSSKVRKKVEANKLKSTEGIGMNSDQLHCTLKAEPKALIF